MPQYAEKETTITKSTDCGAIYNNLTDQNEWFLNNLNRLESIGHKFKDTNVPSKGEATMSPERPSGFLPDISNAIERFRGLNNHMDEVLIKFEEII